MCLKGRHKTHRGQNKDTNIPSLYIRIPVLNDPFISFHVSFKLIISIYLSMKFFL